MADVRRDTGAMRGFVLDLGLLLALGAWLALPPAARAEQDETGPNFEVPADLDSEPRKQYERALAAYVKARTSTTGQSAAIAEAIREMKKARTMAKKLTPVRYYLGILYQWTRDYEEAQKELERACELNPTFHQAWVELGDVHAWLKEPDQALARYARAIEVAPDYAHTYIMRGYVRLQQGLAKEALADVERAKALRPDDAQLERLADMVEREVKGPEWETTYTKETERYVVLTPVSQEFADDIAKHAELVYRLYTQIFPAIPKESRKFPIIVHGSKEEYRANGGPPTAGGHYSPFLRKLYLFRYDKPEDTHLVLYHEGFHQFLHDYLDDAPQWFDEGLGDFFGPSVYVTAEDGGGRDGSMRLRPNPWRLRTVQEAIRSGRIRTWRELMLMSQAEMYDREWAGIHYAEAWSIIYFLVRGGARPDANTGPHFSLLSAYFTALRKGASQEAAFESTFGRADLRKLERAWREFILELPPGG